MTTALGCPSCGAPLTGAPQCPSCGLALSGPLAYRLWQVDQQLAALQGERRSLLEQLRSPAAEGAPPAAQPAPSARPEAPALPPARVESSPQQVQNTLLTLGAVLLAGAGVVFTAVTYQHLGVVGRALVLLVLTAAALATPARLLARGLTASAESVAGVGVVLALLDLYALRHAGLARDVEATSYTAVAVTVLAALLAAYSLVVPVRTARASATVLSQLPLPLVLARLDAGPAAAAAWLAVQAGADLAVAAAAPLGRSTRRLLAVLGAPAVAASLLAGAAAVEHHQRSAWVGFALLATGAAAAGWRLPTTGLRDAVAAAVVPLLTTAAWAAVRPDLTTTQQPLVLTAVSVLALQAVALLPRDRRAGAAAGALGVAGLALLVELEAVLQAVTGPFTWLADPWSRTAADARGALALDHAFDWGGTVVTLVVLAGAALAAVTAGVVLDRVVAALVPAGALLVLTGLTLPLGLATSYPDALALQLVVAGVLCAGGLAVLPTAHRVALALVGTGVATALVTAAWSTADRQATLVVVGLVALACAGLSVPLPGVLTGLALGLGAAELGAAGADRGLAADQVGGLLLAAVAASSGLTFALRGRHRLGAEVAAGAAAVAAVSCATGDPGWLSWTLAGSGLVALVLAVHPDRRAAGLLGGLLLSASSWVRLADAHVHAPEPYVAPLAAAALVVGVLRRRSHPTAGSWEAYGSALALALVPSLLRSFTDSEPTRGLLLLVVCVAVVVAGATTRQQAPLAVGAAVGLLDALRLVAPVANALPRWVLLAALGLLLVGLGATYESRLRDVRRMRTAFDALR